MTMLVSDEVKIVEVDGGVDDYVAVNVNGRVNDKVKPIAHGPRSFSSPLADA